MTEKNTLASAFKRHRQVIASKNDKLGNKTISQLKGSDKLSKITVMVPEELHQKIKMVAVKRKTKIRDLIIGYIQSL